MLGSVYFSTVNTLVIRTKYILQEMEKPKPESLSLNTVDKLNLCLGVIKL